MDPIYHQPDPTKWQTSAWVPLCDPGGNGVTVCVLHRCTRAGSVDPMGSDGGPGDSRYYQCCAFNYPPAVYIHSGFVSAALWQ